MALLAPGSGPPTDHLPATKYGLLTETGVSGDIRGTCGSVTHVNPVGK